MLHINDDFIEKWEPRYEEREHDEEEYHRILKHAREDIRNNRTLSRDTFKALYEWKASRSKWRVTWNRYETYADRFRKVISLPPAERMGCLCEPHMAGIGIPVASTILHFMFPNTHPIVDVRTTSVLKSALVLSEVKSLYHYRDTVEGYNEFTAGINRIHSQCPTRSLRQIDKALFAYHKSEKSPRRVRG